MITPQASEPLDPDAAAMVALAERLRTIMEGRPPVAAPDAVVPSADQQRIEDPFS